MICRFTCFSKKPKDKKKPKDGLNIPDRKEHPFLVPLIFSNGTKKDAEGWQVYGIKNAESCDPDSFKMFLNQNLLEL